MNFNCCKTNQNLGRMHC